MFNTGNITMRLAVFVILTVLCSYTATMGKVIYVDDDAPVGVNDGSSWENAFNFLQDALAAASDGDEIRVAQGIYTPDRNSAIPDGTGDREAAFQLISEISLIGGYAGFGELNPDDQDVTAYETILSGDLNGDDVDVNNPDDLDSEPTRAENSYSVVTCSSNTVLDGFIISSGNADGTSLRAKGSGMYNDGGSPIIMNCTFNGNLAYGYGGGICNSGGKLSLVNCTFTGNYSSHDGGGMYNTGGELSLIDCTFTNNYTGDYIGSSGGGICNTQGKVSLTNCTFMNNYAREWGGGIFNYKSDPCLTNCTFTGNMTRYGGGICNDSSSPIITDCKFIGNVTRSNGGGLYNKYNSSPVLSKCVFIGNTAAQDGGGLCNSHNSSAILNNCTFVGNLAGDNGGGIYTDSSRGSIFLINCTFTWNTAENGITLACDAERGRVGQTYGSVDIINCILWDRDSGIWIDDDTIINISYSNIRGGWEGLDNIDEDPLFVEQLGPDHIPGTEDDDLRLAPVSPCIDTGDPDYAAGPNETDLDGNPRIVTSRVDMGAYEFQGYVYVDDDAPYEQWRGEPEIDHLEEDGSEIRPFSTIQEAIDIAKDGYTVLVKPGVYEKIDFKGKAITVAGTEGAAVIEAWMSGRGGPNKEDAVTFHTGEGPGSVLKNFIIKESATAISLNFSSPTLHNLTIVENDFGIAAYENSHPDIRNCILWDNSNGDLFQCQAMYSCIENGIGGEGNINVNPLFVDAANGDYYLKSEGWRWNTASESWTWDDVTSRCIDAGDPCSPLGDEPMSVPRDPNNLYGINQYINMGAYGGTCQASMPPLDWIPPEDNTPPEPNPSQWAPDGTPQATSREGRSARADWTMTAMEATDASGSVEYFFECTTDSTLSSGWQRSLTYSVYADDDHRFRVKARDLYGNETAWSEVLPAD